MPKHYVFAKKKKKDPSLGRIITAICVLLALAYGGLRLYGWLKTDVLGSDIAGSATMRLEQAQALLAEGDTEAAAAQIDPILDHVNDHIVTPQAILLRARIHRERGEKDQAGQLLEQAYTDYKDSPEYPHIAAEYAQYLEVSGNKGKATAIYEELRANAPPEMRAVALVSLGAQEEADGNPIAARKVYRQAVCDAEPDSEPWHTAVEALGRLNVELIFAPRETPESKYYTVEPGDTLLGIGVKLNTTQGLLTRANGLENPESLRPEQRLKTTPKDFRILIDRSACRLYLLDSDGLFKMYRVGLGMPGYETAPGRYTIGNKQKDPTWFKPGSEPVPPGDPRNELGTRWMPLVPVEEGLPSDLGIHGTIEPETIGKYKSHGCPRMLKNDVEELYDLVVRSTPVTIVESVELEDIEPC